VSTIIDKCGGLMKMVRLNLAQHKICTGQEDADPSLLNTVSSGLTAEIDRISCEKQIAIQKGYSRVNPSNYQIDHIYADYMDIKEDK